MHFMYDLEYDLCMIYVFVSLMHEIVLTVSLFNNLLMW